MLPGLEIFADAWDNKPEAITELEIEDLMQPSLFDEVAVITSNDGNQDLLSLIKPNKGPLTNWYTEEERTADKTLPEQNLESGPDAKSCTESESDPESEIELESNSESSVSDVENPDFKFDVIFEDDSVLINKSLQIIARADDSLRHGRATKNRQGVLSSGSLPRMLGVLGLTRPGPIVARPCLLTPP
ncbi:hypothetical protein JCGZ_20081 [Jatropha curcas]|uniref:Uncharacterized protein n=1 Tax=Jatropha curcas TaxID=180498 RepID=A0A067K7B8_JATCU|nr:hypothetical protein JCGZ_20081 [Jatropha curcas]